MTEALRLDRHPEEYRQEAIVRFLKGYFKDFAPEAFRFSDDESITRVFLSDEFPDTPDTPSRMPSVQVQLQGTSPLNIGLDARHSVNYRTGDRTYAEMYTASYGMYVHCATEGECRALATEVALALRQDRSTLRRLGRFHATTLPAIGPVTAPGVLLRATGRVGSVVCVVQWQASYVVTWSSTPTRIPVGRAEEGALRADDGSRESPLPLREIRTLIQPLPSPITRGPTLVSPSRSFRTLPSSFSSSTRTRRIRNTHEN